mmetsp:Transcript_25459/g.64675  ORF Transcript_25459/g.64675 Transcript_25459/m.64675 type:complete len:211 (-) Transcript_25459:335-967(-)
MLTCLLHQRCPDFLDRLLLEAPLDGLNVRQYFIFPTVLNIWCFAVLIQDTLYPLGTKVLGKHESFQTARNLAKSDVVRGKAGSVSLHAVEPPARERQVVANVLLHPRQKPRASYVGKKPNARLGHREQRVIRAKSVLPVHGQPNAPTHRYTAQQSNLIGCLQVADHVVQSVLRPKKIHLGCFLPEGCGVLLGKQSHVSPSTEGPITSPVD